MWLATEEPALRVEVGCRRRSAKPTKATLSHPLVIVIYMSVCIDCDSCVRQETSDCEDCVVTFITSREANEAVVIELDDFAALKRLQAAGMVPELRHQTG